MPPVTAAIAAVAAKAAASFTIGSIISSVATSLVLSGLQRLIAGKPSSRRGGQSQRTGITQQVRQPIIVRKPVYGEVRRSGGILYIGMSSNNKFLHMVIEVAPHEIAEIGEVWLNDYSIPPDHIDGSGNVTQGRYQDIVRIKKFLGTDSQAADPDLVSEVSEWTTAHRLRGIAYIYIRLEWNEDKFPTGVPNVSAWLRGKKVFDPRLCTTLYSDNVANILNDYLEDDEFGLGADSTDIDQTFFNAAANTCDEFVTVTDYADNVLSVNTSSDTLEIDQDTLFLQRGDRIRLTTTGTLPTGLSTGTDYYVIPYQRVEVAGVKARIQVAATHADALAGSAIDITGAGSGTHTVTKTAEPRYSGAIVIDTEIDIKGNIEDILSGMSGTLTYSSGVYRMFPGAYQTPSVSFDENNLVSGFSVQTKVSKRERFNTVRGVYTSSINNDEPTDYPEVTNASYVTSDGEIIVRQIDIPTTNRPHTAQRIAKINLELSRQEITWTAQFDLSALQVAAGDNAIFTIDSMGWSNKVFQIKRWEWETIENDGNVVPVIRMEMREIAAANYDWNNGEETAVDPAPNTTLPSAFDVDPPTGLAVNPREIGTAEGDLTYEFDISWTAPSNEFVVNGGFYKVQFKRSADTDWVTSYRAEGDDELITVKQVQPGINYDVRIRAVNTLGVKSQWANLFGFTVDSPSGATIKIDYGQITASVVDSFDWGSIADAATVTNDYGGIT